MKIALAHKRLALKGGTEKDLYRTAEALRDLGHEVHLFCGEFGIAPPEGIQTHRVPSLALGRTARLLSFAFYGPKVIFPWKCDLVMSFGRMVQQDILRCGGGSHKVFLQKIAPGEGALRRLWYQVSPYHRSVLALERLQYRPGGYKKILAVSQEVKREITATYEVPAEKVAVIYNGVDDERFHPRNRDRVREKIKKQWGIPLDARLVLFVGRGFQRKGLSPLLRAWGSQRLKGIYLLAVGEDTQQKRYAWAARQLGAGVVFTGIRDNIEDYYGAADLLALPAFQEGFGNVVLEALASGLPVLVSRAVGAAEVLTGELERGILSSPNDSTDIESKILELLDHGRWRSISQEARKLGEKYSWKNHFRELERHLQEVAEQGRSGNLS